MKVYFYVLISFLILGVLPQTWAQQQDGYFNCGQDEYYRKVWEANPQMKADYEQLFQNSKQVTYNGLQAKTTFTIPVVFHIIHQGGTENISDAQVYDQMDVLNRDYNLLNNDYHDAVAGFDTIAASANINFKLAAIDPYGNCTNGIEHIYSHETMNGDDFSKLNQWPRSHYLNVWVVKSMRNGVAGYAYYPTAVDGSMFSVDGIIILNQYIGRIGTGAEGRSRALTHEIGHWLGLAHCWGSTNEPGVACGDDGIEDTPITKGFNYCPTGPAAAKICDSNIVENYQNYMEYSYCSVMFTRDQVSLMRNMLQGPSGNRNLLITDSIHHLTGIDLPTVPQCAPIADFVIGKNGGITCIGESVNFSDQSWNSVVDNRTWTFQDATPATSSSPSPNVVFNSTGWKTVTLTVSNAAGTDTKTVTKAIFVYKADANISGADFEDMNGNGIYKFIPYNPEPNGPGFDISWYGGVNGSACYELKNYKDISSAQPYSNESYYYSRLGGSTDYLYSPKYDLRYMSGAKFSFDYAYATDAFDSIGVSEVLNVYTSDDCGISWIRRKTIKGSALLTGGNSAEHDFTPTNSQWKNVVLNIPIQKDNVMMKIEFVASDNSNNLYIDNIKMDGVLMTKEDSFNAMDINVYPNPSTTDKGIYVEYNANDSDVQLVLSDLSGKVLSREVLTTKNAVVNHKINTDVSLQAGIYLVTISQNGHNLVKKVVIL